MTAAAVTKAAWTFFPIARGRLMGVVVLSPAI
jgi:hypothetical protein